MRIDKENIRAMTRAIPFAVSLIWKTTPYALMCFCVITIALGFAPTLSIWVHKYVLDSIVNVFSSGSGQVGLHVTLQLVILEALLLGTMRTINRLSVYVRSYISTSVSLSMRSSFLKRLSELDFMYFEDFRFHDKINRAASETGQKPLMLVSNMSEIVKHTVTVVSMGIVVLYLSPLLFAASIALCMPYLYIQIKYGREVYNLEYHRTQDLRRAGYLYGTMISKHFIPEILSFGLWPFLFKKWLYHSKRFAHQDISLEKRRSLLLSFVEFSVSLGKGIALGYIVYLGLTRTTSLTVGDVIMYSGAFVGVTTAFGQAFDGVSSVYKNCLFINNILDFRSIQPIMLVANNSRRAPDQVERVEVQNVSFKYTGRNEYALRNISLVFQQGQRTLVVGENGAGKTTLMKLLVRLYDPTEGRILLNGVDIREYDLKSLHAQIGVVFQSFLRLALSVNENIACRYVDKLSEEREVVRAAQKARIDPIIRELPLRYKTVLSKEFENGQELSFGQWQRICMARLFFKDAPVFILDEPTASLDIETEAHLLREIGEVSCNKICVFVSHRMFRKGIADQIVVMQKGKILETGTYESLVIKGGEFARFCQLYNNTEEEYLFRTCNKT